MRLRYTGLVALLVVILASCGNPKELRYFQGNFDTAKLSRINYQEPIIQVGDVLSIKVYSDSKEAADLYNMVSPTTSMASGGSGQPALGYEVGSTGFIQMAGLGNIKVEGLTLQELQAELDKRFVNILSHPYYNTSFLNFKVTVLGDVNHPGTFTFPVKKVSILDALGIAGDLTIYGKRDNILIVREENGKREFGRLNLKSPDVFQSEWFYLRQNDLVYVDMLDKKAVTTDQTMRWIGISTAVISTVAVLSTLIITLHNK